MVVEPRGFGLPSKRDREVKLKAVMYLSTGVRIEGMLQLNGEGELVDLVNRSGGAFLAVQEAEIEGGGRVERVPLVVVNKQHIVALHEPPA